jgi:segregation and condensation protein A
MSDDETGGAADETFESQLDVIRIRLQSFEGPLDLLVHLIRKNKVDVYDIPIALITRKSLATSRLSSCMTSR